MAEWYIHLCHAMLIMTIVAMPDDDIGRANPYHITENDDDEDVEGRNIVILLQASDETS